MENNKKRFYLYSSWQEQIELLSVEEQATMLMNFFRHAKGEEPVLNTSALKLVWAGIKFLLETDDAKYQAAVERGQKAGQSKKLVPVLNKPVPVIDEPEPVINSPAPVTNEPEPVLKNRYVYDNVNVNVNDNDNDNDNDNENVNENGNENDDENDWMNLSLGSPLPKSGSSSHKNLDSNTRAKLFDEFFADI